MQFRGSNLKETLGRAVRNERDPNREQREACGKLWRKTRDLADNIETFERQVQQLHSEIRIVIRSQFLDTGELVADLAAVALPLLGRARRVLQILVALRRVMRGGRMSHVVRELRDFIDVLSDLRSAVDNIQSLIRSHREIQQLNSSTRTVGKGIRMMEAESGSLIAEAVRRDCDNLREFRHPHEREQEPDEGDSGFFGVGFGKKR